jgi:hypothetical protein
MVNYSLNGSVGNYFWLFFGKKVPVDDNNLMQSILRMRACFS